MPTQHNESLSNAPHSDLHVAEVAGELWSTAAAHRAEPPILYGIRCGTAFSWHLYVWRRGYRHSPPQLQASRRTPYATTSLTCGQTGNKTCAGLACRHRAYTYYIPQQLSALFVVVYLHVWKRSVLISYGSITYILACKNIKCQLCLQLLKKKI